MEFRSLSRQYKKLKTQIDEAISNTLSNSVFIGGPPVISLEKNLAKAADREHCITCANGTDAIELILHAWEIGEGDAVFVPDFTFFATAEPVAMLGATPIFVDVHPDTFNMDAQKLSNAIDIVAKQGRLQPKAIIVVDLYGQTADYDAIQQVAERHNLLVFEDAAQSFGASYKGRPSCSFGHAATTSFFPAKPLGCYGDGGAIFTDDAEKAALIRSLVVHGKGADKYDNVRIGRNSRLDTIQAAILQVKLDALYAYELNDVNNAATIYTQMLTTSRTPVGLPNVPESMFSSWAQYTVRLAEGTDRAHVIDALAKNGIPAMVYYPKPLRHQTAFKSYIDAALPPRNVSEELSKTVLSLPMHPYLHDSEIEKVCSVLHQCLTS